VGRLAGLERRNSARAAQLTAGAGQAAGEAGQVRGAGGPRGGEREACVCVSLCLRSLLVRGVCVVCSGGRPYSAVMSPLSSRCAVAQVWRGAWTRLEQSGQSG